MIYGYIKNSSDKYNFLLPVCCFIAVFGALSYWNKISDGIWQQEQRLILNQLTITYAIEIENKIKHTLSPQRLIEQHIDNKSGSIALITPLVEDMLAHHPSILRISFSPGSITALVFPLKNNQHLIGRKIKPHTTTLDQSEINQQFRTFYSPPIKNDNDQVLFSINKPHYIAQKFWGYISYQINITDIIAQVQVPNVVGGANSFQLSHVSDFHKLTILAQSKEPLSNNVFSAPVKVPENNWLLEISFNSDTTISLFGFGMLFRLLFASVISLILYFSLLEPKRLRIRLQRTKNTLANREILLASILDNTNDGIVICDNNGKVTTLNNKAQRLYNTKLTSQLTINTPCFLSYQGDDDRSSDPHESPLHQVLYNNEELEQEIIIASTKAGTATLASQSKLLLDINSSPIGAMLILQDITKLTLANKSNNSRNVILDKLAHDEPINAILTKVIEDIQRQFEHIQGAVVLLANDKIHLAEIIAPNVNEVFKETLRDLKIGERVMSSGSAIFHNKMIIVEDVNTHPYWIDYKHLAQKTGIRSSWSQPILSSNGELFGSFDLYCAQINPATPKLVLALKEAATLTALCIERHRDAQRLLKISLAVQHSPNSLIIIDINGIIEYVNPKFCKITGYQPIELIGQPLDLISVKSNNKLLYKEVWQSLRSGKDWRGELQSIKKNGDAYWAYDHVSAIKDQAGKITKFVIVQEDITENRQHNQQLDYQQNHDLLTGLINNHAFGLQIKHAIKQAKEDKNQHALCIIDLDNFKKINQQCGQVAGDELLRQTSTIFRGHLRQRDTLARLNGDQFAILMKDCSPEPAKRCCIELILLLANHNFVWQDKKLSIRASIGITSIDQNSLSIEDMMQQADTACHLAKAAGGNKVKVYHQRNPENEVLLGDARFAQEIRQGINNNKFKLFVQPVVPINRNNKRSLEILLRLELSDGQVVTPKIFLPAAMRYNLAKDLDLWVIERTVAWFADNHELLEELDTIAINLTYSSFGDEAQLIKIINLIEHNPAVACKITFEITEYTATSCLSKAYNFMQALKQYNVRFALDSYGSGYLSLAQIKNVPISTINIDGRLINDIQSNPISRALVLSICQLAKAMNIKTVAKYVEDPSLIEQLALLPIDAVQGFSQGRPVSIEQIKQKSIVAS